MDTRLSDSSSKEHAGFSANTLHTVYGFKGKGRMAKNPTVLILSVTIRLRKFGEPCNPKEGLNIPILKKDCAFGPM